MNEFEELVPINADTVCTYNYTSGTLTSTVCSDPLKQYSVYGFDLLVIGLWTWLIIKILARPNAK